MTTDLPDFHRKMVLAHEGGFVDLAELAFRLGAATPGYAQGQLIFQDDFELEPVRWIAEPLGATSVIEWNSNYYFSKGHSIMLLSGEDTHDKAQITLRTYHRREKTYGLGFMFMTSGSGSRLYARVIQSLHDETYYPGVIIDFASSNLYLHTYLDEETLIRELFPLDLDISRFWPVYLTWDLTTGYYKELFFGTRVYDVSGYKVAAPGDSPDYADIVFANINEGGGSQPVFIDNVFYLHDVL